VAVISLTGKLMKQQASMGGGTSTVQARRDIRAAASDPDIGAILLRIDSPGGTAAGTKELADEITAAKTKKPVWAYVEDMAASAAYWAASQASRIIANETALVGSIGTYGVVQDTSGMAAMEGVKVHVIRSLSTSTPWRHQVTSVRAANRCRRSCSRGPWP
jgi:protease-4